MSRFLRELGYVGFGVSSLKNWGDFAVDVLSVEVKQGFVPGTSLIRLDKKEYRIILVEDGSDEISFVGWEAFNEAALDAYALYLDQAGVDYRWGDASDLKLRGIEKMLYFFDPEEIRHEAFVSLSDGNEDFVSPLVKSGYVTSAGGLGHVVFGSKNYARSVAFANNILGAETSDTICEEIHPGVVLAVTFFHINERHHSIAYADKTGLKKIHHFMLEVGEVSDVGKTRDRHIKTGLPIIQDIGQHPNDKMISYYGAVPSGFLLEYGWGGLKIEPQNWQIGRYSQLSEWGHRPLITPPN